MNDTPVDDDVVALGRRIKLKHSLAEHLLRLRDALVSSHPSSDMIERVAEVMRQQAEHIQSGSHEPLPLGRVTPLHAGYRRPPLPRSSAGK